MAAVTMPKDCYDTLLQRLERLVLQHDPSEDHIVVRKGDYDSLIETCRRYAALRAALVAGGISSESLDVLSSPLATREEKSCGAIPISAHPAVSKSPATATRFVPGLNVIEAGRTRVTSADTCKSQLFSDRLSPGSNGVEDEESSVTSEGAALFTDHIEDRSQPFENNHDQRSLVFKGISNRTTLADLARVIRGGQILNFFIRPQERQAHVSFVSAEAAEAFYLYSKRSDIYILDKRVEVFWDDRQRYMPGHIGHKIDRLGATRNLVIRWPRSDMTADSIQEDLDHIHRLEIVGITFDGGQIYVSLNDINIAVTARTCMSSRLKYKGAKIEFYDDECAGPLPKIERKPPKQHTLLATRAAPVHLNPFSMLAPDDQSGDDDDE